MTTFINVEGSDYTPFGLSAGAVAGDLVFASGMALDLETLQRVEEAGTIADETRICIEEVEKILHQVGCGLEDLVKCNCYLGDDSFRGEFWQAWDAVFADVGAKPLRLTQVVGIAGDCRVEISAIAVRTQASA